MYSTSRPYTMRISIPFFSLLLSYGFAFVPSNLRSGIHRIRRSTSSISKQLSSRRDNNQSISTAATSFRTSALGSQLRRTFFISTVVAGIQYAYAQNYSPMDFERIPTQFIAALGDSKASSGDGAEKWGLWRVDPGPRGVWLRDYNRVLQSNNYIAPAGWHFNSQDWWLEEHGLIMESPEFPMPAGRYLVTGDRKVTTALSIDGQGNWKLEEGTLYDVTHLPCRSARYSPNIGGGSPLTAKPTDFPVRPGAEMPLVAGCNKQDYAVLFVIGKEKAKVTTKEL